MRAIVIRRPGDPTVFEYEERERPEAGPDQILIRIRAFGLNRAEIFTRQGHSPGVEWPRVIGIECVGEVVDDPSGALPAGTKVAAMMGGMGRQFDGSYAEYTVVPAGQVLAIDTDLSWERFAALPEMFQTARGSLKQALRVTSGKSILVRGGTSSVGLAAISLAKSYGLFVAATSRNPERESFLRDQGADLVLIDDGRLADRDLSHGAGRHGFDYVLELIGTHTLNDSLDCLVDGGTVCMTGILAGSWELNAWNPMQYIRSGCYLTAYSGTGMEQADLQEIVTAVERGELHVNTDRVFEFEEIVEAHIYMEANRATGKLVVRVS
ncbi:MAG: zinc-binding alcohol dehydrogenase family protein [bacterium]|nr:zinc-binding alcohol dehydrogenase family protein [bacterium]